MKQGRLSLIGEYAPNCTDGILSSAAALCDVSSGGVQNASLRAERAALPCTDDAIERRAFASERARYWRRRYASAARNPAGGSKWSAGRAGSVGQGRR